MANRTAPRNTTERQDLSTLTVTAGGTIYAGGMVALNGSGLAIPASSASCTVVGRAENTVSSGGQVKIRRGCFCWDNDTTSGATAADVGKACYVKDDHTVTMAGGSSAVVAGYIKDVDADGVHVSIAPVVAQ